MTFLGPSTPAAALGALVARVKPDVVAISCSMTSFLPGAGRCVAACAGVPVIVGGAAFGDDDRRARRVGTHGWAGDARDLPAVVERLAAQCSTTPAIPERPDNAEHLLLEALRGELIGGVLRELCERFPGLLDPGQREQECRDGVALVVDVAGAALYVEDDEVLRDALAWWSRMLGARGLDLPLVPATLESLASRVEGAPGVRALLGRVLKDAAPPDHHPLGD